MTQVQLSNVSKAFLFKFNANKRSLSSNSILLIQEEHRAGETRFIFSLIQILPEPVLMNTAADIGKPIFHDDPGIGQAQVMDWQGMNVILEYKNMEPTDCDVKSLGNEWASLSNFDLDSQDPISGVDPYLEALQAITDKVTIKNANTNGINGSAISQIRTNTKLFMAPNYIPPGAQNWTAFNWNLREFGLDPITGNLVNKPTANMPYVSNNTRRNTNSNSSTISYDGSSEDIVDWIYGINGQSNKNAVLAGNHNIPEHLLQPSSEMVDEQQSYFDLGFWDETFPDNIFDTNNYMQTASPQEKEIRHQLSLNTCSGCHGGETKTAFTMIRPLGYGEAADYWSTIPSSSTGLMNSFSQISNKGFTADAGHKDAVDGSIHNHEQSYYEGTSDAEIRTIPNVSPFLTGRNYRGTSVSLDRTWDDDLEPTSLHEDEENPLNFSNELVDKKINGLFYVNDPSNTYESNSAYSFPQVHYKKYGYNELEKRRIDLCHLISSPCGAEPHSIISFAGQLNFIPLPPHGH